MTLAKSGRYGKKTCFCLFIAGLIFSMGGNAQYTVVAGPQYETSPFHQWLWGKHYRKEWTTPVTVPGFLLDTAAGGLKPYQEGGGRQSKSIRLQNPQGKEYVLRSIDKTFGNALPPIYRNTFIENIVNDQVSIGHPYSAVTIPTMAKAAGIYHAIPRIVYLPRQHALDSFNKEYANRLYLFEQRPDENWEEAPNFGYSKKIVGTEKMLENILEDNDRRVDQLLYVRSRLFDMLIGDASRHEDQWRWASFESKGKTIYRPIPRDRDQAFIRFDGKLLGLLLSVAGLGHLQTFDETIPDVRENNFPARNLDRQMANQASLEHWVMIASDLQAALTDEVIEKAVGELPPEVYPISGKDIIAKLKSRRDDLVKYAQDYYLFLAEEVDVVGSEKKELFTITRLNDEETRVTLNKITKEGKVEKDPFYYRIFKNNETREVRLYGLKGNDVYRVDGHSDKGMLVRIIGGSDKDSIVDMSDVSRRKNVYVYDDHKNTIIPSGATRLLLSNDDSIHNFQYKGFSYDDKGIYPKLFYSYSDRIYVGLGYGVTKHGWRKEPFASDHELELRYSLSQRAFSVIYEGAVTELIGKWNLAMFGNYDWLRWTNYFGLGNETLKLDKTKDFYRMRSREAVVSIGVNRKFGKYVKAEFAPLYKMTRVLENRERFLGQSPHATDGTYKTHHYGGLIAGISVTNLNDPVVPTKGIYFTTSAEHTRNLHVSTSDVTHYNAGLQLFMPLMKNLVVATRTTAATLTGDPEFYQYNAIGGSQSLRGYPRDRFRGNSAFASSHELQLLFNAKTKIFNGKMGLIGLYDIGRVWLKGEESREWHDAYGGGILIAPFNKVMFTVTYATSQEGGHFHLRYSKKLD